MWFGDLVTMRVVGRPVAEGVVRHLGLQLRLQRARRRPGDGLGVVHQRVQELGVPAGSTALDPPDRRRHGRPRGGRAELRRHHLRQGRLGARPARRLRRPGRVPGRCCGATSSSTRTATPRSPTCWPALARRLRPRPVGLVGAVAGDHRGEHPAAGVRAGRRRHDRRFAVRQSAAAGRTRRCASTGSPSGCTRGRPTPAARSCAGSAGSRPTSRAPAPRWPSSSACGSPTCVLLNDDDLSYAKVRLDPAFAGHGGRPACPSWRARWPARSAGPSTWDMCRDAELPAADYVDLVLLGVAAESDPTAVARCSGRPRARSGTTARWSVARRSALRWQQGVTAAGRGRARLGPPAGAGQGLPGGRPGRAGRRPAGRLADRGRACPTGLRIDPELRWSVVLPPGPAGAARRRRHRRRAGPGPDRSPAPSRRPRRRPPDPPPRPSRRPGGWPPRPTRAQRHPASDLPGVLAAGPGRRAGALRRDATSPRRKRSPRTGAAGRAGASRCAPTCCGYLFPVPRRLEPFLTRLDEWRAGRELAASVRRPVEEGRDNAIRALRCQQAAGSVSELTVGDVQDVLDVAVPAGPGRGLGRGGAGDRVAGPAGHQDRVRGRLHDRGDRRGPGVRELTCWSPTTRPSSAAFPPSIWSIRRAGWSPTRWPPGSAVVVAHTNADVPPIRRGGGAGRLVGLRERRPLRPAASSGPLALDKIITFVPADRVDAIIDRAGGRRRRADRRLRTVRVHEHRRGDIPADDGTPIRISAGSGRPRAWPRPGSRWSSTGRAAERCGTRCWRPIRTRSRPTTCSNWPALPSADVGLGRVGQLDGADDPGRTSPTVSPRPCRSPPRGLLVAGEADRVVRRVAVQAGAGDDLLDEARQAGADAYVTSDLRHHPASEASAWPDAPALIDISHWAAEWTWLPVVQQQVDASPAIAACPRYVSTLCTDPWAARV